jgi:SAM-dependent methyltransferase
VSGFSTDWLALREPFDAAARAAPREVVDLACGTGSNLRALAPLLGRGQRWRVVDHDPALLDALPGALRSWAGPRGAAVHQDAGGVIHLAGDGFDAQVQPLPLDLAHHLDAVSLPPGVLLTGSALLDLVSESWLDALVARAREARASLLFTLSVDGRIEWDPADADDAAVHARFEAHQGRDKGFGPALGPGAVAALLARLPADRWATRSARADWRIDGAASPGMLQALIDGTAAAALEQAPSSRAAIEGWRHRRSALRDRTRLRVGHLDVAARPRP